MATHKSAIKRHRQSEKRQTRNRWWKSRVRTASRSVEEALTKKDKKGATDALVVATREIQKAETAGVYHANTVSRKISRLSKRVAAL